MNKKIIFSVMLVGILALILVTVGCSRGRQQGSAQSSITPGSITVNGLPGEYNGKYISFLLESHNISGGRLSAEGKLVAVQISDGTARLDLYKQDENWKYQPFPYDAVGNGWLWIWEDETMTQDRAAASKHYDLIDVYEGSAAVSW